MTDLNLIDTDTLAAACRTAAVSSAHADLLNAAAARLLAQASWIDGAKVDLDGYDDARAAIDRLTGALAAIGVLPSASKPIRDIVRDALLDGGATDPQTQEG